MANLVNFAVLLLKAKVGLPSISSVQIDRQRSRLARLVLTDSYRGIALSGSNTTLPSIIRLGGVGRFRCPNCFPSAPESEQYRRRRSFPGRYGEGGERLSPSSTAFAVGLGGATSWPLASLHESRARR